MILNEKTHLNDSACDRRHLLHFIIITADTMSYCQRVLGFYVWKQDVVSNTGTEDSAHKIKFQLTCAYSSAHIFHCKKNK